MVIAFSGCKKQCEAIAKLSEKGGEKRDFFFVPSLGDSRCGRTCNSRQGIGTDHVITPRQYIQKWEGTVL